MEKPLFKRLFVFGVRDRKRLVTKSGLFLPPTQQNTNTKAEDLWILASASDCLLGPWKMGQHILVADYMELQDGADLWEKYKYEPEFIHLKKFSEDCEGSVRSFVIHEDSVLGEVLGDLIQNDSQW